MNSEKRMFEILELNAYFKGIFVPRGGSFRFTLTGDGAVLKQFRVAFVSTRRGQPERYFRWLSLSSVIFCGFRSALPNPCDPEY